MIDGEIPGDRTTTFLRNAWYMIAWRNEIDAKPLVRTALEIPILLFRTPGGEPIAMHDRCPHRFAPLSSGKVADGIVSCGYHGLQFNTAGYCVRNPFSKAVPRAARVRTFPVVEQDEIVWIWLGDAPPTDSSTIAPIAHHTDPQMRCVRGRTTARADYRLLTDNLMDLSHTALLHPAFGGEHYVPKYSSWEEEDGSIVSNYVIESMPNFLGTDAIPAEFVQHEDQIRWIAASVHILSSRTSGAGKIMHLPSAHILTPETLTTTHYFWSSAVDRDSPMTDADHLALLTQAFDYEDKPMVEAVQQRMNGADFWNLNPVLLPNDVGSVRVRRKLAALIQAERLSKSESRAGLDTTQQGSSDGGPSS